MRSFYYFSFIHSFAFIKWNDARTFVHVLEFLILKMRFSFTFFFTAKALWNKKQNMHVFADDDGGDDERTCVSTCFIHAKNAILSTR